MQKRRRQNGKMRRIYKAIENNQKGSDFWKNMG